MTAGTHELIAYPKVYHINIRKKCLESVYRFIRDSRTFMTFMTSITLSGYFIDSRNTWNKNLIVNDDSLDPQNQYFL